MAEPGGQQYLNAVDLVVVPTKRLAVIDRAAFYKRMEHIEVPIHDHWCIYYIGYFFTTLFTLTYISQTSNQIQVFLVQLFLSVYVQ